MALTSSRMLNSLVDDILDMARLEQGRFELNSAPFYLGELLRAIDHLYRD